MAFPPRPRSSRAEPSFVPVGSAARDPVQLRPAAPRAARPAADDGAEREPLRLAVEAPALSLDAADRLIVSADAASTARQSAPGLFGLLGFALLLALAALGAYTLYQWVGPFLR